jgi:ribonuclease R
VLDEKRKALIGAESGATYRFGRQVKVRLIEATPVTGGLIFEMLTQPEPGKKPRRGDFRKPSHRGSKHRRKRR